MFENLKFFIFMPLFLFVQAAITPPPIQGDENKFDPKEFISQETVEEIKKIAEEIGGDFAKQFGSFEKILEAVKQGDLKTVVSEGKKIIQISSEFLSQKNGKPYLKIPVPLKESIILDPTSSDFMQFTDLYFQTEGEGPLPFLEVALSGYDTDQVTFQKDQDKKKVEMETENVKAQTKYRIKIDQGQIYIVKDGEEKLVKKLPAKALREIVSRFNKFSAQDIDLTVEKDRALYQIKGNIKGRILWLIPVTLNLNAKVNAESGALEEVIKPWWEIFVF